VNAPTRLDSTPVLQDFPYRLTGNFHFADLGPNQHGEAAPFMVDFSRIPARSFSR
jgi:acyl-CoA thioester hydrolase